VEEAASASCNDMKNISGASTMPSLRNTRNPATNTTAMSTATPPITNPRTGPRLFFRGGGGTPWTAPVAPGGCCSGACCHGPPGPGGCGPVGPDCPLTSTPHLVLDASSSSLRTTITDLRPPRGRHRSGCGRLRRAVPASGTGRTRAGAVPDNGAMPATPDHAPQPVGDDTRDRAPTGLAREVL